MSQSKATAVKEAATYSPFWALLIVFVSFIAIQSFYLKEAWNQRNQIRSSIAEVNRLLPQAATVEKTLENLGRELVDMAPKSPEAAKIINEFKIQVNSGSATGNP